MNPALRFVIDEDFDNDILRGVLRRLPELAIVRVQSLVTQHDRSYAMRTLCTEHVLT
jgi:hypothetical protein